MKSIAKPPMNPAQLMVLQIVKEQYNEKELAELSQILVDFNHRKMQNQLDETVTSKGYSDKDFEQMLKGHSRKKD